MSTPLRNNITKGKKHFDRISELLMLCDQAVLVSPYLMSDFEKFFAAVPNSNLQKLELITTFKPHTDDQIKKIPSLKSFYENISLINPLIKSTVGINDRLHAKVYIFSQNGNYISAIISSANLTQSGLEFNDEWGIEIDDKVIISDLVQSLRARIQFELTHEKILKMENVVQTLPQIRFPTKDQIVPFNLLAFLESQTAKSAITYWLKPVGASHIPIIPPRSFDLSPDKLHFSTAKPSGVKIGDILIAYGVGAGKILSIYRVISEPYYISEQASDKEERWPWYVVAENLTPNFGSHWWECKLYTKDLVERFIKAHPNEKISRVGRVNLNALKRHKDKIALNPLFARYIIDQVSNYTF